MRLCIDGYLMFNTFINAILTQWPHTFGANLEKGVENVTGLKAILVLKL